MNIDFKWFWQGVTSCLILALLSLTVGTGSGCRKLTWFIIGQLAHSRPADLGGHTQYLQGHVTVQFIAVTCFFYKIVSHALPHLPDGLQLFKLCCVSWERHRPLQHLYENTPSSPETNKDSQPLKSCMSWNRSVWNTILHVLLFSAFKSTFFFKLTKRPEPWSNLWIRVRRQGGGTTASPLLRRRSDWEWTWNGLDLNQRHPNNIISSITWNYLQCPQVLKELTCLSVTPKTLA